MRDSAVAGAARAGHAGAAAGDVAISVRGLRKTYGAVQAVKGLELEIKPGEIFGLIGSDGAGKTSTFQILGGVMPQTAGTVEMFGRP
ncbi:MAG TPA: ATP-binding cassette domain-containing protein, partial [Pyrinomonadaceae bacterium]|nr:ATP-binding cassette domain-containing protein [Pyrinomonadaceae bacterium]